MIVAPLLVGLAFPQYRDAIVVFAVILPIAAFLLRFYVGRRYISTNRCGPMMRRFQTVVLVLGIFTLMLLDSLVMSMQGLPDNENWAKGDLGVLVSLYCFYMVCMTVSLYPGPIDPMSSSLEHDG